MIREDVSFILDLMNNVDDSFPEMLKSVEDLDKLMEELCEDEEEEKEEKLENYNEFTDEYKEELIKNYNDLKSIEKNPEINNLDTYIKKFKENIEEVSNMENINTTKLEYLKEKLNLLENIIPMTYLLDYPYYGKFKQKKFEEYFEKAIYKMDKVKTEFVHPDITYNKLLEYYKDDELKAKTIMMKFLMYVCIEKSKDMIYSYFIQTAIHSINNENSRHRDEIIKSLEKLYLR